MEFTRQEGKLCDGAMKREQASQLLMYYALCFLMPILVHTLLHCGKFRHKLISRISRYKKIREIKVKRAISVAIIT